MKDLVKKLGLRELRLLLLGVGAVVTTLMVVSIVLPKVKALVSANQAISTLKSATMNHEQLEQQLSAGEKFNDELKFRLFGEMADLPENQIESYIIGRLQKVSWDSNIELVSVEPQVGEQVEVFQELLFKVRVVGQYSDLYQWLWDLRNELGYVVVEDYSLRRTDENDASPVLMADLSLASYRAVK